MPVCVRDSDPWLSGLSPPWWEKNKGLMDPGEKKARRSVLGAMALAGCVLALLFAIACEYHAHVSSLWGVVCVLERERNNCAIGTL